MTILREGVTNVDHVKRIELARVNISNPCGVPSGTLREASHPQGKV